jgi:hypothetical protein
MDTAYRYVLVIVGFSLLVVGLMNYFAAREK